MKKVHIIKDKTHGYYFNDSRNGKGFHGHITVAYRFNTLREIKAEVRNEPQIFRDKLLKIISYYTG